MKKLVLLYGTAGGLLVALLRLVEYRWLVLDHATELYGGVIAALFAAVGLWLGRRLTPAPLPPAPVAISVPEPAREAVAATVAPADFVPPADPGVSPRELEILRLMAEGLTNREIAERLFVSENTVKTHSSRLFEKLGARRRTQAVQLGRQRALIP